ncbi:Palmitoyltransferase DHHC domain, partial [Trinorchestia longiramus]
RARADKKLVPEFDRSLHAHVIENGRCHLCNITITSARTKHCSSCNKCVDVFDHHCKWLNNCIGRRNYRVFLATVITAILSCLLVMATCLTEIILYYFNRQYLAPWEHGIPTVISPTEEDDVDESHVTCEAGSPYCHFQVFGARVYDGAFIGLLSTLFSIALIAGVLLIHLVAFHVYLLILGLTTYEYIRGTSLAASNSANSFGGRTDPAHDGATCGWSIGGARPMNNQITPSSTTDTALLSSPDPPSTTTTSPCTLSPRSNPSTPADDTRHLLGGRHLMVHHKQNAQQLSPRGFSSARTSSVPTLPKINDRSLRTVSRSVSSGASDSVSSK